MNERYQRHHLISGWSQARLAEAHAVIIGMGALGNEVARILAMAGIGSLLICDLDRVERSNLSRTVLFRETDVGRWKVDAAAEALQQLAPGIQIEARPKPLVSGVGLAELRDASIVCGCLDSRTSRIVLAGRCALVQAAYIDGGTNDWGGAVRPYFEIDGPCYACSLSPKKRAMTDSPWACGVPAESGGGGVSISPSALVGSWMAAIAMRFLMDLPVPSGELVLDISRGTTVVVSQRRDPNCPLHESTEDPRVISLGVQDTVARLRAVLEDEAIPLAWEPIQHAVECPVCGFNAERWGTAGNESVCQQCNRPLHVKTTLDLAGAPGETILETLGIPPREILAVRTSQGFRWIELSS